MKTKNKKHRLKKQRLWSQAIVCILVVAMLAGCGDDNDNNSKHDSGHAAQWMSGDFHNHTTFTDGSWPMNDLTGPYAITPTAVADASTLHKQGTAPSGFRNDLDFFTNSEHGGASSRDGFGIPWSDYSMNPAIGDDGKMWRWQSLLSASDIPGYAGPSYMGAFDWIKSVRANYPDKTVMTGMEWNVPGHEHASTAVVADNALPIAEFEYRFDKNDSDGTNSNNTAATMGWTGKKQNSDYDTATEYEQVLGLSRLHNKAIDAIKWMEANYPETGYIVPAHIERKGCGDIDPVSGSLDSGYSIAAFRDMNDNGPDVAFGFEGLPGHSKSSGRGGFGSSACGGGTYGGAGYYIATVGGLWDNLLADGRNFFTFDSSDFHSPSGDFWPGEYERNVVKVVDLNDDGAYTQDEIVAGLRSGNVFVVHGDLINALDFSVANIDTEATMGQTLSALNGDSITVTIRFKSPAANKCQAGVNASADYICNAPVVHHVQLIQGRVNEARATKFLADGVTPNPAYNEQDSSVASIVKTFDANSWSTDDEGFTTMTFTVDHVENDMFFRIRGTNLGYGVTKTDVNGKTIYGTDSDGNPLLNAGINNADMAWEDLWFYSNPIFVKAN